MNSILISHNITISEWFSNYFFIARQCKPRIDIFICCCNTYRLQISVLIHQSLHTVLESVSKHIRINSYETVPLRKKNQITTSLIAALPISKGKALGTRLKLRPHLYGLGYPRQPSPRVTLDELTFPCVVVKFKLTFIQMTSSCLGGRDNSGGRSR